MKDSLIIQFPNDIQSRILSFCYFSNTLSLYTSKVNMQIENYNKDCLADLKKKMTISNINYHILKYFLYDKVASEYHKIEYDGLDTPLSEQLSEVERVFKILRLVDVWRLRKYILSKGSSSETFLNAI